MKDQVVEQSPKRCTKNTLSQIESNLVLMASFQHHSKNFYVIFYKTKYYLVIKVDFKKFMYKLFKHSNENSRKYCRHILESKRNYRVLVASPLHCKGSLVSIFFCNSYLMVARESICKWIHFLSSHILQYFICKWSWKWVM